MTSFDVEEFDMAGIEELRSGFVVGILLDPARNREVRELMEIDRLVRGGDALLRSGPAVTLSPYERQMLADCGWCMCFAAVDLSSGRYVGYTSAHRVVTLCRGAKFEIDEVVVHPEFEGRNVSKALMAAALQEVRRRWEARKATLTSRPGRVKARGLYVAFGFAQKSEDLFEFPFDDKHGFLPLIPEGVRPRIWYGVARKDGGAFWSMEPEMQNAIAQICAGTPSPRAAWTIIEPIGVYKYKDAP